MNEAFWTDGERTLIHGDCLAVLPGIEAGSVSLVCTDPPYGVQFMGKAWDRVLPDPAIWRECLRVRKPGGFLFSFMTPRTDCFARFCIQVEDAGFDCSYYPITWLYLTGFPKGHDLSKAADRAAGAERPILGERHRSDDFTGHKRTQAWDPTDSGYGSIARGMAPVTEPQTPLAQGLDGWKAGRQVLKPAHETIVVAQKPLSEKTFLANVVAHGTGGMNTGECAVPFESDEDQEYVRDGIAQYAKHTGGTEQSNLAGGPLVKFHDSTRYNCGATGRHPANVAVTGGALGERTKYFDIDKWAEEHVTWTEESAAVYCPKAGKAENERGLEGMPKGNRPLAISQWEGQTNGSGEVMGRSAPQRNPHPTCKPLALIAWLLTLGNPPGGTVLDPFAGSGTTLVAAKALGMRAIGIELNETEEEPYCTIAQKRTEAAEAPKPEAQLTLQEVAG